MAHPAAAQILEPDGFGPIPVDPRTLCNKGSSANPNPNGTIGCTGSGDTADFACCSNTLDNMSLIGLFKHYESDAAGNILVDFQRDAKADPATFNPLCSIQGQMVMKGGGCFVDFGWYCVNDTNSHDTPPLIYPLVTAQQVYTFATTSTAFPPAWKNNDGSFLPKTGYPVSGTPLSNIASDPAFQACASKKIGFAMRGNSTQLCAQSPAACVCTQNKFTERRLNQINSASGEPYVTAVIYSSKNVPGRFFIAAEEFPTSPTQFNAPVPGKNWTADGDFNDLVYAVDGVVCQGGSQLCTVPGKMGLCATGVTSCGDPSNGGAPTCEAVFKPQIETCNGIDDDCNGSIDDGSNLCVSGQICVKGTCVHPCAGTGEFACPAGQVCVGETCIDSACAPITCNADQKCINGQCVSDCASVVCSAGQQCSQGKCVDLCDLRATNGLPACPDNFVCQNGACVPNCTCLPCPDPTTQVCQSNSTQPGNGRCVASGCGDGHCGNLLCVPGGTCIDSCTPNPCGANSTCIPVVVYDPSKDVSHQYSCTGIGTNTGGAGSIGGATSTAGTGNRGGTSNVGGLVGAGGMYSAGNAATSGGATSTSSTATSTSCEPGRETCPCYGNDTCNPGLVCASHLCVSLGTGGHSTTSVDSALSPGVKSGCGCRFTHSRSSTLALSVTALGLLTLLRRRRLARGAGRSA